MREFVKQAVFMALDQYQSWIEFPAEIPENDMVAADFYEAISAVCESNMELNTALVEQLRAINVTQEELIAGYFMFIRSYHESRKAIESAKYFMKEHFNIEVVNFREDNA